MSTMRAVDAAFLAMERPHEPSHLGALMVFGPSADGPLDVAAVRAALEQRLPTMSSARRVVDGASGWSRPGWRTVDRVDLDVHLHRATIAAGADPRRALHEIVGRVHAQRLDRRRPLWQLHVVDGLGDEIALYAKVHMAALDDTTGVDLMTGLLDDDPAGRPTMETVDPHPEQRHPLGSLYDRVVGPVPDQVRRSVGFPGRLAGRAARAVGDQLPGLGQTASEVVRRWPGLEVVARLLPGDEGVDGAEHPTGRAPRLSFNEAIGPDRRFAAGTMATADLVAVKAAAAVSFHAVALATCAGSLRRWLLANDELPSSPVVAIVPVLVGSERAEDTHVAGIMLALPTHVADPRRRLELTAANLDRAKRRQVSMPASLRQDVAMFAPPIVAALANRLTDAMPHRRFVSPTVNLGISNVPGPRRPVYLAGRPLRSSHPVLSVSDLTPLHLGVQAGPEVTGLGAIADRDHVEDLIGLVDGAAVELADLTAAFAPRSRRRTSAS